MSYILTLLADRPSLHLRALRAHGIELGQLFEPKADPVRWSTEPELEQDCPRIQGAHSKEDAREISSRQFRELCLNEE